MTVNNWSIHKSVEAKEDTFIIYVFKIISKRHVYTRGTILMYSSRGISSANHENARVVLWADNFYILGKKLFLASI